MIRLLLLLLPAVILAVSGAPSHPDTAPDLTVLGKHWSASVQNETDKKYPEALVEVHAYEQEGGDPFLAHERLAWLSYLAGDYAKAEAGYAKAKQLQAGAINPLLGLLNVAQAQKDTRKTERAAEALLHVEPTNYRAQMALAGLHFAEKDYRKAASEYRRVLVNYPDDPDAMSGAAWGAFDIGEKAEALSGFRRLLSISPAYPSAKEGLALAAK